MSMSNTVTVGTGTTPEKAVSDLGAAYDQTAAIEDAKILAAHTIRKFWVHDPPKPGQTQKGHPRTLIAFRVDDEKGVITYAHTTWNPDYPEPFDRAQAVKRAEGRLNCPKRQNHISTIKANQPHKTILSAIMAVAVHKGRTNTARYKACKFALETRDFKATD